MSRFLALAFLTAFASGCATTSFYTNGVLDATASSEVTEITVVATENKIFKLYKVNGSNTAILAGLTVPSGAMAAVSVALILSKPQVESLLQVSEQIVTEFDRPISSGAKIIEFHLTLNRTDVLSSSSSSVSRAFGGVTSSTVSSQREVSPVVFRLQYDADSARSFGPQRSIIFSLQGTAGTMTIEDLRLFIKDLRK